MVGSVSFLEKVFNGWCGCVVNNGKSLYEGGVFVYCCEMSSMVVAFRCCKRYLIVVAVSSLEKVFDG